MRYFWLIILSILFVSISYAADSYIGEYYIYDYPTYSCDKAQWHWEKFMQSDIIDEFMDYIKIRYHEHPCLTTYYDGKPYNWIPKIAIIWYPNQKDYLLREKKTVEKNQEAIDSYYLQAGKKYWWAE